ncbi:LysE family translocator [Amylibacter sp. IMCC11727]|uniref:LysE family translocator n=1 Tax=Amylibacter sp. IMCC11727 TaxID=3039851 RepID=UPI00244E15A3|nr:LysE family translocator [Amylibacter sp. IMCC11727]WGI20580.1 LysE family translocator [Amylibacter sp. IMCC11727]
MINFLLACLFILSTPGPGVLSTAGLGAAYGFRAGFAYIAGLFVGSNLVMLAVISGLAAIVFQINGLRTILLIASTAYLVYLAARIAFAGSKIAFIHANKQPGFWAAVTLQIINPKAYVVGTTMFSGFPIFPDAFLFEVIVKMLILNAVWIPVHFGWLYAGASLKRLNLSDKTQRAINIFMALAMLAVVGLAALSV